MAKMVRLKPAQMRIYRQNVSVVVDESGMAVRDVLPIEEKTFYELTEKVFNSRPPRPQSAKMIHPDGREVIAEARPELLTQGRRPIIRKFLDGLLVVQGREYFKKQILKEHGPCQLRGITGQFMASVRDPSVKLPTPDSADTTSPSPEHCQCRDYAGRESGRHHFICQWNERAPMHEKASEKGGSPDSTDVVVSDIPAARDMPYAGVTDGVQHSRVMNPVVIAEGPVVRAKPDPNASPPPSLPPITAKIAEIDPVPTALAHKLAEAHPAAKAVQVVQSEPEPKRDPMVLLNLQGNPRIIREASADEIAEADKNEAETGNPHIKLGNRDYMVALKSEAEAALRGDYDDIEDEDEEEEELLEEGEEEVGALANDSPTA